MYREQGESSSEGPTFSDETSAISDSECVSCSNDGFSRPSDRSVGEEDTGKDLERHDRRIDDDEDERLLPPHNCNNGQATAKHVSRNEYLENSDACANSEISFNRVTAGRIRRSTDARRRQKKGDGYDYNKTIDEPVHVMHQHPHAAFDPLSVPASDGPDDSSGLLSERAPCEGRLTPERPALLASPPEDKGESHEVHHENDNMRRGISRMLSTFAGEDRTSDGVDAGNTLPTTGGTSFD